MPTPRSPALPRIRTARVRGRRVLRFASYDDLLTEARTCATTPVRTLGNWTCAQILNHLAAGIDLATLGTSARVVWFLRAVAPLLKQRFLTKPMAPGFSFPEAFRADFEGPPEQPVSQAVERLEAAIARLREQGPVHEHPVFGRLNATEWEQLILRHSEMHLSVIVPSDTSVTRT